MLMGYSRVMIIQRVSVPVHRMKRAICRFRIRNKRFQRRLLQAAASDVVRGIVSENHHNAEVFVSYSYERMIERREKQIKAEFRAMRKKIAAYVNYTSFRMKEDDVITLCALKMEMRLLGIESRKHEHVLSGPCLDDVEMDLAARKVPHVSSVVDESVDRPSFDEWRVLVNGTLLDMSMGNRGVLNSFADYMGVDRAHVDNFFKRFKNMELVS